MASVNDFYGVGNIVRAPELRKLPSGTSVVDFCMVINTRINSKSSEGMNEAAFIECEAWDSGAEAIAEQFNKGDRIMVKGRFKTESWEKNGVKYSRLKLRVGTFQKLPTVEREAAAV